MRKVLVAHSSEELVDSLKIMLEEHFQVITCSDGITALELILAHRPEIMILDLMMSGKDGISILEECGDAVPKLILATTRHNSRYISNSAVMNGIGFIMLDPSPARNIVVRLLDMIQCADLPPAQLHEPESRTAFYLHELGLPSNLDGYVQLRVGIPIFARDNAQRLNKELYPAIAKLCGYGSGEQVERSVRSVIKIAWKRRNNAVWLQYFPADSEGNIPCPSNKLFISQLAERLTTEQRKD